ncbi:MAG: hypothetical protein AB7V40_07050 [Methyloceanibacter sp.]
MRSLVVMLLIVFACWPALAVAEETCADKCETEMKACDAATCAPGRRECIVTKCDGLKGVQQLNCRLDCVEEFDPCFDQHCGDPYHKCLAACGQQ